MSGQWSAKANTLCIFANIFCFASQGAGAEQNGRYPFYDEDESDAPFLRL